MPVLPEIDAQTDILFIGWNPGADEVKARRPFVGPSGKLLRGWVKRLGITSRAGYANICLYRPPDGNRKPTKPEILGCAGVLTKLIERVKPKLIVCLGDVPARRFGFKGSVGQMVGRFKIEAGLPEAGSPLVTVLYHPAYAVRLKGSKRFAEVETQTIEVMQEALYRVGGERKVESYDFVKVPAIVLFTGPTTLDTEHVGDPDARVCELTTIQTYNGSGKVLIGPSVLAGNHHPLIFHNAIHDLIVLARHGMGQERVVGDTMVAAWMLGRQNLSLKGLAWRELGAAVMDWEEAVTSEDEAVWDNYCAQDPVLTWRLHDKLYAELQSKGIAWLYDNVEMPLQPILAEASMTGMMVDHQKVLSLWGTMERRMEVLERHLKDIAGEDYNPNSNDQTLAVIKSRGFKVTSTDAKILAKLPHDEFIMFLLAYRKCQGRISKYCRPLSQVGTVTGMFKPCGTGGGRLSQSKRNLQNFPFDVKECLQAKPGYIFVYRDYSQIEVRLAAFLSQDEYLLSALREGRNVHEELCIAVFGYRVPELYTKSKCLATGTPVLTSKLEWKPIEDVVVGENLVAFDEHATLPHGNHLRRGFRTATVISTSRRLTDNYFLIALSDGSRLRVTGEHRVIVYVSGHWQWRTVEKIHQRMNGPYKYHQGSVGNQRLIKIALTPTISDADAGWLAGFLDGEGTINSDGSISVAQALNGAGEKCERLLAEMGIRHTVYQYRPKLGTQDVRVVRLSNRRDTLGLLAAIPSVRLKQKELTWLDGGEARGAPISILSIEKIDATIEVVDLQTTTGTFVADGFAVHNSANFERLYGGSIETRAAALGVPPARLQRVEVPWPGFEAWATAQRESARTTGVAQTYMGRQQILTGIESSDPYLRDQAERIAINMPEQGGAADICKLAMVKAQVYMKQLSGRVAHQEHDSILCEVPISYAQEADQALNEAMTEATPQEIRDVIAIPSKSVISTHWG